MKPSMAGRVHHPTLATKEELVDEVRSRLVKGFERGPLPRQLHLLFGVEETAVREAIAAVDEENQVAARGASREIGRAAGVAVVAGVVVAGLIASFGVQAITALGVGAATVASVVVIAEMRRRRG
jgi:hypothetical protein